MKKRPSPNARASKSCSCFTAPTSIFFSSRNYSKYQNIVDLAAKLDAFDVFYFKMCDASAANLGLEESEVPPFIEFVPYGPDEIERLKSAGFVQF